jgi:hypothetical protein
MLPFIQQRKWNQDFSFAGVPRIESLPFNLHDALLSAVCAPFASEVFAPSRPPQLT